MEKNNKVKVVEKEFHELANIFPLMNDAELNNLAEDIKKNGLIEPIVLLNDKILDGRNRYIACKKINYEPSFKQFQNHIEALDYVLSGNLYRRHLNTAQKCELGINLLEIEKIEAQKRMLDGKKIPSTQEDLGLNNKKKGRSINIVAKKVNVGHNTLRKAIKIKEIIALEKQNDMAWDHWVYQKWQECLMGEGSIDNAYNCAKYRPLVWEIRKYHEKGYRMDLENEYKLFSHMKHTAYAKSLKVLIDERKHELEELGGEVIFIFEKNERISIPLDSKNSIEMTKIFDGNKVITNAKN